MKELLEQKYTIKIIKNESNYYVYNYFGRLIFIEPTLYDVERRMKEYYKEG